MLKRFLKFIVMMLKRFLKFIVLMLISSGLFWLASLIARNIRMSRGILTGTTGGDILLLIMMQLFVLAITTAGCGAAYQGITELFPRLPNIPMYAFFWTLVSYNASFLAIYWFLPNPFAALVLALTVAINVFLILTWSIWKKK
jgi:hypothetical protein